MQIAIETSKDAGLAERVEPEEAVKGVAPHPAEENESAHDAKRVRSADDIVSTVVIKRRHVILGATALVIILLWAVVRPLAYVAIEVAIALGLLALALAAVLFVAGALLALFIPAFRRRWLKWFFEGTYSGGKRIF